MLTKDTSSIVSNNNKFELKYDKLLLAVGSEPNTFGTKGVKENTLFLKTIEDAALIRERIIDVLETACLPQVTIEEKKQLCNFLVVGGGVN